MFESLGGPWFWIVALAGLFGGVVRGYSGFGFALAAVPILTIAMPPSLAVPAVFPVEFTIGLLTLPFEWEKIDFRVLKRLAVGAAIGTPFGVTILRVLPSEWMRVLVGLAVVAAVVRAWKPSDGAASKTAWYLVLIGTASGGLNGGTGMSGPPVIVTLLDGYLPAATARATLMAFIAMSALFGVILSSVSGSYVDGVLLVSLRMVPAVAVGCIAGIAIFSLVSRRHYRAVSLSLLMLAVSISLTSTFWFLLGPPHR